MAQLRELEANTGRVPQLGELEAGTGKVQGNLPFRLWVLEKTAASASAAASEIAASMLIFRW